MVAVSAFSSALGLIEQLFQAALDALRGPHVARDRHRLSRVPVSADRSSICNWLVGSSTEAASTPAHSARDRVGYANSVHAARLYS
jgi:hypothetical protein